MKIDGIVIKDEETGKFTAFIRQFPGICAQGDTIKEANEKVNTYFKAFIDKIRNERVIVDEDQIASM